MFLSVRSSEARAGAGEAKHGPCTVIVLDQQLALCHHAQSATRNHAARNERNLAAFCVSGPDTVCKKKKKAKMQRTEVQSTCMCQM